MAWEREGGDKHHDRFVHHFREYVAKRGKNKGKMCKRATSGPRPSRTCATTSQARDGRMGQRRADDASPSCARATRPRRPRRGPRALDAIHELPVHETALRREIYRAQVDRNPRSGSCVRPSTLGARSGSGRPISSTSRPRRSVPGSTGRDAEIVRHVAQEQRFFHWELEFPDVFRAGAGFDAVIGNPPWEIAQAQLEGVLLQHRSAVPRLRQAGGAAQQTRIFESTSRIERTGSPTTRISAPMSNWSSTSLTLRRSGRRSQGRRRFASVARSARTLHCTAPGGAAFGPDRLRRREPPVPPPGLGRHQHLQALPGIAHALLRDTGASASSCRPASTRIRAPPTCASCSWRCPLGVAVRLREPSEDLRHPRSLQVLPGHRREGRRRRTRSAPPSCDTRSRTGPRANDTPLAYPRARVEQFSPQLEGDARDRGRRDLEILEKIYANGVLLGDDGPDGWGIKYAREFDMTNDSKLFPPRPKWEEQGYRGDEYGHWLKGAWRPYDGPTGVASVLERPAGLVLSQDSAWAIDVDGIEDVALPLYEGRMIGQFDFSAKGWVSGRAARQCGATFRGARRSSSRSS